MKKQILMSLVLLLATDVAYASQRQTATGPNPGSNAGRQRTGAVTVARGLEVVERPRSLSSINTQLVSIKKNIALREKELARLTNDTDRANLSKRIADLNKLKGELEQQMASAPPPKKPLPQPNAEDVAGQFQTAVAAYVKNKTPENKKKMQGYRNQLKKLDPTKQNPAVSSAIDAAEQQLDPADWNEMANAVLNMR
jgi:hypothetical protein